MTANQNADASDPGTPAAALSEVIAACVPAATVNWRGPGEVTISQDDLPDHISIDLFLHSLLSGGLSASRFDGSEIKADMALHYWVSWIEGPIGWIFGSSWEKPTT